MKCTVFLVVFATTFVAVANAKVSHSIIAALRRRQPSLGLHRRSGINPSSVSKECQPTCTPIIQKLDGCSSATCECTQANFDALGSCMNCLTALGPQIEEFSTGDDYLGMFQSACAASDIILNIESITATPTGISSTGDPLSIFDAPTPTSGETVAVTASLPPLIPTPLEEQTKSKIGGAAEINAFWGVYTSAIVAAVTAVAITTLGVPCL
ncbi:hypothetical protein BJV74DRAFT_854347 [Russula compacta]|nr:hypothetical protein BJV74DRAFT_854347 [Russula compacta]